MSSPIQCSFIVPAHNESFEITRCLDSIFKAGRATGRSFEVLVVNDASTDDTESLARAAGARVLDVHLRKISAVRNAGARTVQGQFLFFVDADTQVSDAVVRTALAAMDQGAIGGGAWVDFEGRVGFGVRAGLYVFGLVYSKLLGWAAGCFVFARRSVFEKVGGFDETLYASEEIWLSRALKQRGRFVVLRESVTTSARKMRMYSLWNIIPLFARLVRYGPAFLKQPRGLEWWYEGKREKKEKP